MTERLLVIKLADLGDVLTVTPALEALRAARPEAHITALVTPQTATIIERSGDADAVLTLDKHRFDGLAAATTPAGAAWLAGFARELAGQRFNRVALVHHLTTRAGAFKYRGLLAAAGGRSAGLDNGRGGFLDQPVPDAGFGARHEVEYALAVLERLGAAGPPRAMRFATTPAERDAAARLLAGADWVAIHPGSGAYSTARRWSQARFRALTHRLQADGLRVVAVGGAAESALTNELGAELDLAGRTGLGVLAAVLERCRLVIDNDSGVGQLAAAVGTRLVSIFGPSNAAAWAPWRPAGQADRTLVLTTALGCQPCLYTPAGLGHPDGCPPRSCLRLISVEAVLAAAQQQLARP